MLFNLFKSEDSSKPSLNELKKDYRRAIKMLERAMAVRGINSKEAIYWSEKADELEEAIANYN